MVKLERTYNIPLRKEWLKVAPIKRSKKAMVAVRSFLQKHMKSDEIKLGEQLNNHVWKHGIKNPPHHIKVTAIKDDEGIVRAELFGHKIPEKKKEEKKGALEGLKEKITGQKKEPKKEQPKGKLKKEEKTSEETRAPEAKKVQKEEKNASQRPAVDKQA